VSLPNSIRRPIVRAGLAAVGAAIVLGGLIYGGRLMRDSLRSAGRYQFAFNQVECPAPAGMSREQFLSEVRYYGEFPESASLLDDNLRERLTETFSRHAWVERVDGIDIHPDHRIQVRLTFREPVLAVTYGERGLDVRAVDRLGIVLPRTNEVLLLPALRGQVEPPQNGIGRPWGNPRVESAAKIAEAIKPHQGRLRITEFRWKNGDLWFHCAGGADVAWGKPADERATVDAKLRRLLQSFEQKSSSSLIDLRSH
jgi:hypothetical protein